ncbi:MAG: branched-chain amino acid ABC transporter permease [Candidatus Hydrothermarchaeota archaeon]|nr:MAG: branched-chain amino acid ABC transporter permease [Candidatus Hydrothermarchaeota archaeon]
MLEQVVAKGIVIGGIYSLAAIGLSLILGVMQIVNLAHGELMMLAMYITFFLFSFFGMPPFLSIIFSAPILFLLGAFLYKIAISKLKSEEEQIIFMIGLVIFLENLVTLICSSNYRSLTYRSEVIKFFNIRFTKMELEAFVFSVIVFIILFFALRNTSWGRAIRACSQNPELSELVGINVERIKMYSFAIGASLAAAAGSLVAPIYYISPTVGFHYTLIGIVIVALAGAGNILGALFGGFLLGVIEALTSYYLGAQLKDLSVFLMFILILLLKPRGLFGGMEND